MAYGVFLHRTDSIYEDIPAEQYQFPKQYLSRALQFVGDWVVYLEPSKVKNSLGYFAIAKVQEIIPDPNHDDMFIAIIEANSYLDFGKSVLFRNGDQINERGLLNEHGRISGRAQAAVRPISEVDFSRILEQGLIPSDDILPRVDEPLGFEEEQQGFEHFPARIRVDQLTNRTVRDRNFRKAVIRAYEKRCAITGLKLINGGGRAEVEAAHIRSVEHNGPDVVSNGIALSGTAHWMFDRGLVGLSNDMEILVSRQANDVDTIHSMINSTGHLLLPDKLNERPHSKFVSWHREHCFKH